MSLVNATALRLPFADSVFHTVVTSPPYWGLRAYADNPPLVWGGGVECEHVWGEMEPGSNRGGSGTPTDKNNRGEGYGRDAERGQWCAKCGAWLGCYGLEPSLDLYVANTVLIFREVWRVMRPDATLWLNLGDSYATGVNGTKAAQTKAKDKDDRTFRDKPFSTIGGGLKPKDLCGVPWRIAFALQADGWWLRRDIVWSKPNPMPESVTDRPTTAHEYVFLMSKSERYYYDAEAVREPSIGSNGHDLTGTGYTAPGQTPQNGNRKSKRPDGWDSKSGAHGSYHREGREHGAPSEIRDGRNLRSVWSIPTQPYSGAHFATFPEALAERCILAGTSQRGVCPVCGAPWGRVTGRECEACGALIPTQAKQCDECGHVRNWKDGRDIRPEMLASDWSTPGNGTPRLPGGFVNNTQSTGWRPTCACGRADTVPARVFDPFVGSGTVVQVARRQGRQGYGVDISLTYLRENALPRAMRRNTPEALTALPLFQERTP